MLKDECSRFLIAFSFLNSALIMCDLGLPVDFSHSCISFTLLCGPCSCPSTVPASVFWTHPTRPSFFPSAWMKENVVLENMALFIWHIGTKTKRKNIMHGTLIETKCHLTYTFILFYYETHRNWKKYKEALTRCTIDKDIITFNVALTLYQHDKLSQLWTG